MKAIEKIKKDNWFSIILFVFFVRFLFCFFPSFDIDMGAWISWANRLNLGFANFYSDQVWTQYTPGFLYWLYFLSKINLVNKIFILLPVIIADILTGLVITNFVKEKYFKKIFFLLYVLNPAVIFVGSVWGQIDGILALFLVTSLYYLTYKKKIYLSSLFFSLAFLIKPQAIMILPVFIFVAFKNFKFDEFVKSVLLNLLVVVFLSIPFFPHNIFFGIFEKVIEMSNGYQFTSLFAYNIWLFIAGMWQSDESFKLFGMFLSILFIVITFLPFLLKKRISIKETFYLSMMCSFIFFFFPTRSHERYLFVFFPMFLIYILQKKNNFKYVYLWFILSILYFLNVYYAYAFYNDNILRNVLLLDFIDGLKYLIALFYFSTFLFFLINSYKKFFDLNFVKFNLIWLVLFFAFLTRIFNLQNPQVHYFDEVYHAFTAQKMIEGDVHAWDWRGIHPKGFAYEWTHPPIAKEIMAVSMVFLGQNAFSWRLPAVIFGTLSVYLVYLIAKKLFNKQIALTSAFVYSLDGLPLVMSRIGMNDIYFLFFALLSLYLVLENKYCYSAFFYGLSLASKWSALWLAPVIFVAYITKDKKSPRFFYFFFIPLIIYFVSYLPMFFLGHNITTFIGLQKQMWWYHTRLDATHPFSSPWWSWPFLIRPIWLYTSGVKDNLISNIYAMGNPIVFWFGFASVVLLSFESFLKKNKKIGFIIFSYFVFFVPWALSPRIMFLYHYLPSIPFLAISTGIVLEKYKKIKPYFFILALLVFIYFYPRYIGLYIPNFLNNAYKWLPSW